MQIQSTLKAARQISGVTYNSNVEDNLKFTMTLLVKTQSVNISSKGIIESKSTVEIEKLYQ